MMATWLLTLALGGHVVGQTPAAGTQAAHGRGPNAPRLLDCIEAPYAYLALDAAPATAGAGRRGSNPVLRLLGDPSLDALFGRERPATASGGSADAAADAGAKDVDPLAVVRSMLELDGAEFELAMTGIVDRKGLPLLVLRARLQRDEAQRLQLMFDAESGMAVPHRRIGDRQTYVLREQQTAGRSANAHDGRTGEGIELAICGDDLIVGNDGSAMREVLTPLDQQQTAAVGARRVLSADPHFLGLRKRANVQPGSLLVFGDWQRLGRRLQSSMRGASAHLLASSGLDSARAVMMTLSPVGTGADATFHASMQFEFEVGGGAGLRGPRHEHGIEGWFAATESVEAKALLRELPHGGLGGMVLSVDLAAIASSSPRSAHLVWDLREAFDAFGLDFDRNVLGRLGRRGTVQLSFGAANANTGTAVAPAWTLRAINRKAAADLFTDLRRVVESEGLGKLVEARDPRGKRVEVLSLGGEHHQFTAFVALSGDSLLLAEEQDTLIDLLEDARSTRPRRRDQLVGNALQSIGREKVSGLFDLDLEPLFARIAEAVPGVDLSGMPRRHAGTIDIDRREDGAVVLIQVVSSR